MSHGTVIPISSYQRHSSTAASGSVGVSADQRFEVQVQDNKQFAPEQARAKVIDPVDLYSHLEAHDGNVIQALRLLKECCDFLLSAARIDASNDFIEYDERMMRVRACLRKLYALREIGDGFGATINAILWALKAKESEALTARQNSTITEVLNQLRKRPMMHFDSSMSLLDQLEDVEFDIEPPFINSLTEFEDE